CFEPKRTSGSCRRRRAADPAATIERDVPTARYLPPARFAEHRFQFFDEVVDVLELAVHRSEPDERHLIDVAEHAEDPLADAPRRDFALEVLVDVGFDFADDSLDLLFTHRALVARLLEPRADLLAVEGHPRSVLLDDLQGRLFDLLVRRKPPAAFAVQ